MIVDSLSLTRIRKSLAKMSVSCEPPYAPLLIFAVGILRAVIFRSPALRINKTRDRYIYYLDARLTKRSVQYGQSNGAASHDPRMRHLPVKPPEKLNCKWKNEGARSFLQRLSEEEPDWCQRWILMISFCLKWKNMYYTDYVRFYCQGNTDYIIIIIIIIIRHAWLVHR